MKSGVIGLWNHRRYAMVSKSFPRDEELFRGWERVPWPDVLPVQVRMQCAIDALRQWNVIPHLLFSWAVIFLIEFHGGSKWIEIRPRLLNELDDVYHCRGSIIASGWKPPRYVEHRGQILCFDDNEIAALISK